jgi:hypothetical protein
VYEVLTNCKNNEKVGDDEELVMRNGLKTISRVIREINHFKQEHKIFNQQFIYRNTDYREYLLNESK